MNECKTKEELYYQLLWTYEALRQKLAIEHANDVSIEKANAEINKEIEDYCGAWSKIKIRQQEEATEREKRKKKNEYRNALEVVRREWIHDTACSDCAKVLNGEEYGVCDGCQDNFGMPGGCMYYERQR